LTKRGSVSAGVFAGAVFLEAGRRDVDDGLVAGAGRDAAAGAVAGPDRVFCSARIHRLDAGGWFTQKRRSALRPAMMGYV
jgi:hypothetical protein